MRGTLMAGHMSRATRRTERSQPRQIPPPHARDRPAPMSDAEALERLKQLHASDRRSSFAQALFPFDPTKYRSRGEWAKAVGQRVASDIRRVDHLRIAMQRTGYKPGEVGYTLEQRLLLVRYYGEQ